MPPDDFPSVHSCPEKSVDREVVEQISPSGLDCGRSEFRMTWEEAGQICFDQLPLTAKQLPIAYWNGELEWQKRIHMLFTDEQRLKTQVDEVTRRFSSDRASPKIPAGILNYLVCCRFLCASDTVNILLAGDQIQRLVPDPTSVSDFDVLCWLLVETWNAWRWDSFLKLQALRSLGGEDSFDGPSRSSGLIPHPLSPKGVHGDTEEIPQVLRLPRESASRVTRHENQ